MEEGECVCKRYDRNSDADDDSEQIFGGWKIGEKTTLLEYIFCQCQL